VHYNTGREREREREREGGRERERELVPKIILSRIYVTDNPGFCFISGLTFPNTHYSIRNF